MKSRLSLLAVLCLLISAGCPTPKMAGSILDLPLDGSLVDTSGNHHDATAQGKVHYGMDRYGHFGKALVLDGSAYLTVNDAPDLNFSDTSSFTISVWLKTTDTNDISIVRKGPAQSGLPGYKLGLKNGKPYAFLTARINNVNIESSIPVADRKWHLLTLTAAPDTVRLYVDTILAAHHEGAILRPDSLNHSPLLIGGGTLPSSNMHGQIDAVIITPGTTFGHGRTFYTWTTEHPPGAFGWDTVNDVALPDSIPLATAWEDSTNGYCCGSNGMLQRLSINGTSVSVQSTIPLTVGGLLRRLDFSGNKGIVVGDQGTIYTSTNAFNQNGAPTWNPAGINWPSLLPVSSNSKVNIHDVKFLTPSSVVLVGAYAFSSMEWRGFWVTAIVSTSGNLSVNQPVNVLESPIYSIGVLDQNNFFVGGYWDGIASCFYKCTTNNSMNSINLNASVVGCDFCPGQTTGVAIDDAGFEHDYQGSTWNINSSSSLGNVYSVAIFPNTDQDKLFAGNTNVFRRSVSASSVLSTSGPFCHAAHVSPSLGVVLKYNTGNPYIVVAIP